TPLSQKNRMLYILSINTLKPNYVRLVSIIFARAVKVKGFVSVYLPDNKFQLTKNQVLQSTSDRHVSAWMFPFQNLRLLSCCNMNVYLCGANGAVSENLLDQADIHPLFDQICGKGMPEHMRGDLPVYPGTPCISVQHSPYGLFRKSPAP